MTKYKMFQKSRIHPLDVHMINNSVRKKKNIKYVNNPIAFLSNK
mgnify:FL=1